MGYFCLELNLNALVLVCSCNRDYNKLLEFSTKCLTGNFDYLHDETH